MSTIGASNSVGVERLVVRAAATRRLFLGGLLGLLVLLVIASLTVGPADVSLTDIRLGLASLLGLAADDLTIGAAIVEAVRAPRTLLALCVGAALGLAGAALQGLFRNPLVDPGLIGVSAGGALGAALWIVFGSGVLAASLLGGMVLALCAFIGSFIAMIAVYFCGRANGGLSVASMLLAGIAVNALAMSGVGLLSFFGSDQQLRSITFWTLGSVGGATWQTILPSVVFIIGAGIVLASQASRLNLLALGEREARHLGCDTERLKRVVVIAAALATGAAVAVSGIIGFVGLVAPHLVRLVAGSNHQIVMPGSALLGACLLLAADLVARMAVAPAELPIGVVTSFIGAPFFLWLLLRRKRKMAG